MSSSIITYTLTLYAFIFDVLKRLRFVYERKKCCYETHVCNENLYPIVRFPILSGKTLKVYEATRFRSMYEKEKYCRGMHDYNENFYPMEFLLPVLRVFV